MEQEKTICEHKQMNWSKLIEISTTPEVRLPIHSLIH